MGGRAYPCTALPCSHTAAYPRGIRHSMCCAISLEWGLFGHNTRSAILGTSSPPKLYQSMQSICNTLAFIIKKIRLRLLNLPLTVHPHKQASVVNVNGIFNR